MTGIVDRLYTLAAALDDDLEASNYEVSNYIDADMVATLHCAAAEILRLRSELEAARAALEEISISKMPGASRAIAIKAIFALSPSFKETKHKTMEGE